MIGALSKLQGWELDKNEEDIRGWPLHDTDGRLLGDVRELIADTDTRAVTAVVLTNGKKYPAHDILIGVRTLALAMPVRKPEATRAAVPSKVAETATPARVLGEIGDLVVPIVDEEVDVELRRVDSGGVRLESHVVSEPFKQDVHLNEERVTVERTRLDRPLAAGEAEKYLKDETIEMTTKAERPVVDKRARVVEEVVLKKESSEHAAQVHETVRHTEAKVDELPGRTRQQGGGR